MLCSLTRRPESKARFSFTLPGWPGLSISSVIFLHRPTFLQTPLRLELNLLQLQLLHLLLLQLERTSAVGVKQVLTGLHGRTSRARSRMKGRGVGNEVHSCRTISGSSNQVHFHRQLAQFCHPDPEVGQIPLWVRGISLRTLHR